MKRIAALDGWRGIAILMVLFDHTQAALLGGYSRPWMQTGQHGVTIFFVLSGFLITSKLLQGPMDLKRFYVRRLFRLMPVAWAYLIAVSVLGLVMGKRWIAAPELAACVLFYRNYFGPGRTLYAGHFWSLSIEEQFYLVWPCLLLLAGIRRCRWLAATACLVIALYRTMHWASYDRMWQSFRTEVRADALLVGCLMALLLADPRFRSAAEKWVPFACIPGIAAMLFAIAHYQWLPPLFESVSIAILIAAAVLYPQSHPCRLLASPVIVWMGAVSYSVYVWQQFFFVDRGTGVSLWMMCLMPVFALASYYWIERPATRLGHRLTQPKKRRASDLPGSTSAGRNRCRTPLPAQHP